MPFEQVRLHLASPVLNDGREHAESVGIEEGNRDGTRRDQPDLPPVGAPERIEAVGAENNPGQNKTAVAVCPKQGKYGQGPQRDAQFEQRYENRGEEERQERGPVGPELDRDGGASEGGRDSSVEASR